MKEYGYYTISEINREDGVKHLKSIFPSAEADELNFCIFSTSGVHGSYETIEDIDKSLSSDEEPGDLTVLVIKPRLVSVLYGSIKVTKDDIQFLKKLRDSSRRVMSDI